MPNTYLVRFTYTFTTLNHQLLAYGAYGGWFKYVSATVDGTFPDATSGQVRGTMYLAPFFYQPKADNIGRMQDIRITQLVVTGGKVVSCSANQTIGPLDLNLSESRFSFANTTPPPPLSGGGMVAMDNPVQV